MTSTTFTSTFDALADTLTGDLVLPADPRWDSARAAWNLAVDQRPAAVVNVASVRDVVATIESARVRRLHVAPQGTGHNAAPLESLADTILLRTGALREVQIDPDARVARVEAGALWADVSSAAAEHGLAALAGSSPDVGVVGYTLGGGLSWLGRSHGLAANHVLAIELVTTDGVHRRVDADHHPELFWALRGGGGDYGVVTALEFRLFPIREVYAGARQVPDAVGPAQRFKSWTPFPEAHVAVKASAERLTEALAPWRAATQYGNFVERAASAGDIFGSAVERLRAIKAKYDPAGVIRSNHPVRD